MKLYGHTLKIDGRINKVDEIDEIDMYLLSNDIKVDEKKTSSRIVLIAKIRTLEIKYRGRKNNGHCL